MTAKSILNMNWTRGTRELQTATQLTELEAIAVRVSLAYELQNPKQDEANRMIGNNIEADALHDLVEFVKSNPAHILNAETFWTDAEEQSALAYGDADLAELQARHDDWLDEQQTMEDARY